MKVIRDLFKKKNIGQIILLVLFIIYLIMGYTMPITIANFINTSFGKIVIIIITIILIINCNPILGVISVFVAYELIKRATKYYNTSYQQGLKSLAQYNPKEKVISSPFTPERQWIPYTLEQEMVQKLVPLCDNMAPSQPATYVPNPENIYDATILDENN